MTSSGVIIVTIILVNYVTLTSSCYITNCPLGGKRSIADAKLSAVRQCFACGPRGMGRCFGPKICCGPEFGCNINTRDSSICQLENSYPIPCDNKGASCGNTFSGKCAADGVCCSEDQCVVDEVCKRSEEFLSSITMFKQ